MQIKIIKELPRSDDFSFTAIDFERANNSMASICSVGVCVVKDGAVVKCYEMLVRPPHRLRHFTQASTDVHGLTAKDVCNAPNFSQIWEIIRSDIEGRPLVAHSYRNEELSLCAVLHAYSINYDFRKFGHLCTLELAKRADIHSSENKFGLAALCELYGIALEHHHSGEDARACAQLLLAMAKELGAKSFRELADFSQSFEITEPNLPDTLHNIKDVKVLHNFVSKIRSKKQIALSDCPKEDDMIKLETLFSILPAVTIKKEEAMSAHKLYLWFKKNHVKNIKPHRYRTAYSDAYNDDKSERLSIPINEASCKKTAASPTPAKPKREIRSENEKN